MTMAKKLFTLVVPFMMRAGGSTRSLLLGRKLRGFGAGLVNGFGGKVEPGEEVVSAAVRELHEECGVRVSVERMRSARCGRLHFIFHGDENSKNGSVDAAELKKLWEVHIFFLSISEDDAEHVAPSDEMKPEWFDEANLPYTYVHTSHTHTHARTYIYPYVIQHLTRTYIEHARASRGSTDAYIATMVDGWMLLLSGFLYHPTFSARTDRCGKTTNTGIRICSMESLSTEYATLRVRRRCHRPQSRHGPCVRTKFASWMRSKMSLCCRELQVKREREREMSEKISTCIDAASS